MSETALAIDAADATHTLTLTRRFKAPLERVWRAWTERDEVARWFGPESVTCTVHEWHLRPGGAYSLSMIHGDGSASLLAGEFREVSAPHRLVYTWVWGGDGPMAGTETLLTLEFTPVGDMTELRLTHTLMPDARAAELHGQGWTSSFVSLDTALADGD